MLDVYQNMNTLNKCYLAFGGSKGKDSSVDLFSIHLTLSVGQFPVCNVSISEASPSFPKMNDYCHVILEIDNKSYTLLNGYISADAQSVNTTPESITGYRQYTISIITEGVDSIPPTAWTYLTNAVNTEYGAVQGYTLVGKSIDQGKTNATQRLALNKNIADMIVKTMDELQSAKKGAKSTNGISKYFSWDKTLLNMPGSHDLIMYISQKATDLIKGGASYIQAIQTLCNEFFLVLIPKKVSNSLMYKMHIAYKPAWGKKIAKNIKLAEYTGITLANSSLKNRTIDGVIMPCWDTTGGEITHLGQYIFYGRKRVASNLDFVITSHKDLSRYLGATTSGLRYKQIPLPSWLGNGLASSSLQRAVKGIVKSYFSLYSYATRKINLEIPLIKFFSMRDYLGEIVSVEAFSNNLEGLDTGGKTNPLLTGSSRSSKNKSKTQKYIGQLMSIALNINFIQSKLVTNCSVSISHVRSEYTEKVLKFTASDLLYK